MRRGHRSVAWLLSIGMALLAAASTAPVSGAHVTGRAVHATPARTAPPSAGDDLATAIRDNAPLPVLLTDAPPAADAEALEPGEARLIEGTVEDVFYGRSEDDPLRRAAVGRALAVLAHRLDLTRDVALGDRVRLVVREAASAGPEGRLDYVEFDGALAKVRLFRGPRSGGGYVDETGVPLDRFLLRTPLAVSRVTSGFGLRLHPVLGYTRMHRGVDFGAAAGTPVLAAADGVVEAAGWDGGYGRRIVVRHAGALETLYAHLSRIAPGVAARGGVRQGEVIGWSGDTGQVTGPHLHFEVRSGGVAIDPAMARPPAPPLDLAEQRAFEMRRQAIARVLAACAADPARRCAAPFEGRGAGYDL
ncbi:M23 family metallopeptidase [Caulobacter soli]|uniref:M23 family metallopeptidase n=1 Tax=Caulobacter soli TaxID=2708539 RepID=UPI0013E9D200|nr:M23 family metallopeptidase [Caulobacter soli]